VGRRRRPHFCFVFYADAGADPLADFSVAQASACMVLICGKRKSKEHRLKPVPLKPGIPSVRACKDIAWS
jgi:hypothetical protein